MPFLRIADIRRQVSSDASEGVVGGIPLAQDQFLCLQEISLVTLPGDIPLAVLAGSLPTVAIQWIFLIRTMRPLVYTLNVDSLANITVLGKRR